MRKILTLVLLLSALSLAQAMSTVNACHKTASLTYEQWPNGIVEVGEEVQWRIDIVLALGLPDVTPGTVLEDCVVTDNLAAELEIDQIILVTHGYADYYTTGRSDKAHLTWHVGNLGYMEWATLSFYVSTDINPAGRHEYTSPGTYYLNSGPTLKYHIDGTQYSLEMNNVMVTVYPRVS